MGGGPGEPNRIGAVYWPASGGVVSMEQALPWANYEQLLLKTPSGEFYGISEFQDGVTFKNATMWRKSNLGAPAEALPFGFARLNRFGRGSVDAHDGTRAFWDGTRLTPLPIPAGADVVFKGTSDDDTVAGYVRGTSDNYSFTIKNGVLRRVTEFDGLATVVSIAPDGTLIGLVNLNTPYPYGTPVALGPGGLMVYRQPGAFVVDIYSSSAGFLAGTVDQAGYQASLWTPDQRYDLKRLTTVPVSDFHSPTRVVGTNSRGQIAINASFPYIVTPVPEPATMTALAVGALALVRKRRKA
jgi:hypothetical protein